VLNDETRPNGAGSDGWAAVVRIRREATVSRIIRAETSRYCEMCRRSIVDPDAAERHAGRGPVVLVTTTTVTAHGCPSDVDRLILARVGVTARG
jgi:hypothetical protein